MQARFIVASDIDFTMMGLGNRIQGLSRAVRLIESSGGLLVLVTAKSIEETIRFTERISLDRVVAVVEAGGAVVADQGLLYEWDYKLESGGRVFEVAELGDSIEGFKDILEGEAQAVGCRLGYITTDGPKRLAAAVGLDPETAMLAAARRYLEIAWPLDECSLEELAWRLWQKGLYTYTSMGFLIAGRHRGKGYALYWLLENTPIGRETPSIGLGDSEPDRDFLEAVGTPVIIPRSGMPLLRLARSDWVPAPYPAPEGWVWAASMIAAGVIKPRRPLLL